MTEALEQVIRRHIREQGPMPFAAFMQLALYHPRHGYYAGGERRTGWHGHFVTSPELDPAFGELWLAGFEQIWEACGRPERFTVVEVGPGEGGFAAAVVGSAHGPFGDALRYTLVERVERVRRRQRERLEGASVEWVDSLDEIEHFEAGCVIANEVIDNLPVHLVEQREGDLFEICIEDTEGDFVMTRRPVGNPELAAFIERCGVTLDDGHRFEVSLSVESFVRRAAGLFDQGALVLIDYGADAQQIVARPNGTLVCYSEAGADDEPLDRVGEKDITVHANWTIVGAACREAGLRVIGPVLQRQVLRALGLNEKDEALRGQHQQAVDAGEGAAAVRVLSRRQALGVLSDPGGLGGLDVVVGFRGIDPPRFLSTG